MVNEQKENFIDYLMSYFSKKNIYIIEYLLGRVYETPPIYIYIKREIVDNSNHFIFLSLVSFISSTNL